MRFVTLLICFFCATASAHKPEESDIWVSFGPTINYLFGPDESPYGGLGLFVEGDVNRRGGLEIGLFYAEKIYSTRLASFFTVEEIKRILVTMGYRTWITDRLGIGLSFATAYSIGDVEVLEVRGSPPIDYVSFATKKTAEYSARLAVEYELNVLHEAAWSMTAFYDHSLHNYEGLSANVVGIFLTYKKLIKEK
jgi:hypothetical protein